MAGGTFLTKNKVRPGAYVNIAAEAKTSGSISDRGTSYCLWILIGVQNLQ